MVSGTYVFSNIDLGAIFIKKTREMRLIYQPYFAVWSKYTFDQIFQFDKHLLIAFRSFRWVESGKYSAILRTSCETRVEKRITKYYENMTRNNFVMFWQKLAWWEWYFLHLRYTSIIVLYCNIFSTEIFEVIGIFPIIL
jgi:hypothetical protein